MDKNIFDLINKQEEILKSIIDDIEQTPKTASVDLELISKTIEHLKEEIKVGKTDDLPALFYQMEQQYNLLEKFSKPIDLPDINSPYFAHMRISESGREKDIYLGHFAFIPKGAKYRIVDWTKAPIAQIYYNFKEGEEFELDLPGKTIEGILKEKNILTIRNGELVRIDKDSFSFVKKDGAWRKIENSYVEIGGGEGQAFRKMSLGTGMTEYESPDVVSLLDAEQFKLLNLDEQTSILLTGGAGSGKTTVALHRIAKLCFNKKVPAKDVLVVVPHAGLVTLSKKILNSIGLHKVRVMTGREWFRNQNLRLFEGICKKISLDTPYRISLLKRHRNIKNLIDIFVERKKEDIKVRLMKGGVEQALIDTFNSAKPLMHLLNNLLYREITPIQKMLIEEIIGELENYNDLREEVFKDKKLLMNMLSGESEFISEKVIDETVWHTHHQFKEMDYEVGEGRYTLDDKDVDFATPFDLRGTIDAEDYPILLLLCNALNGGISTRKGLLKKYKHVVIDEAQESSPVELMVLGNIIDDKKGSFTIAGDIAQKIDQTTGFTNWNDALKDISDQEVQAKMLEVSYRSPQGIIEISHHVLGNMAPPNVPRTTKNQGGVIQTIGEHEAQVLIMINETLERLLCDEPKASIAIICNKYQTALKYKEGLKNLDNTRFIEHGDFSFKPGIDITTVEQVKGLEFDYVIIPDLDNNNYPVNNLSRRRLHLAMTRAIHQLWILAPGSFSPLVPSN